jgi:hypothetical protein
LISTVPTSSCEQSRVSVLIVISVSIPHRRINYDPTANRQDRSLTARRRTWRKFEPSFNSKCRNINLFFFVMTQGDACVHCITGSSEMATESSEIRTLFAHRYCRQRSPANVIFPEEPIVRLFYDLLHPHALCCKVMQQVWVHW